MQLAFNDELLTHIYKCSCILLVEKYLIIEILFQLLLRPISNESAKDTKKPLVTSNKDPSITQGNFSEDQGSGPSETKPVVSISSIQLVYVVADLDKLQEQVNLCPRRSLCLSAQFSVFTESNMCKGMTPSGFMGLRIVGPKEAR